MNINQWRIDIVGFEDDMKIPKPKRKLALDRFPGVESQRAWELANLIRIAATDYKWFNDWFNKRTEDQKFILEEGRSLGKDKIENCWIYVEKEISENILDKYFLLSNEDLKREDIKQELSDEKFFKYKILKTYEFVSFYPSRKEKVDIDRFGFIAERKIGDKKHFFIVFRGTREKSEWFNNAQFRQVDFLEIDGNSGLQGFGEISQGFNKMYTKFRPGILNRFPSVNSLFRDFDSMVRSYFLRKGRNLGDFKDKSILKAINEFYFSQDFSDTEINVTGHSLGGALATIATLDLVATDLGFKEVKANTIPKIKSPINLYTFASPRVGDNLFADKFNEFISNDKIRAFRFANSEDLVTFVPFPVWFKVGVDLDGNLLGSSIRSIFNQVTGGIFEKDYQHVGLPIYFTYQARRFKESEELTKKETATLGDNHNMTASYCGALPKIRSLE